MHYTFTDAQQLLINNLVAIAAVVLFVIALHAWVDSNKHLRKTEDLYNAQPRVKERRAKLSWSGRLLSLLTFKKLL